MYLDENDKQQVLVRATGRVVPADQCGVPKEKRFAFYDQIHTTGMDIKHVVNARAGLTLGKDMVFRDYVQGAYRMRGIGKGQRITVFVIPEVLELMKKELTHTHTREKMTASEGKEEEEEEEEEEATHATPGSAAELAMMDTGTTTGTTTVAAAATGQHVLRDVVAWLVVNSMRSEQLQWSMLCIQNIANIYRKNAFQQLVVKVGEDHQVPILTGVAAEGKQEGKQEGNTKQGAVDEVGEVGEVGPTNPLEVFDEAIDFSLSASVPDPAPFQEKLATMLEDHQEFVVMDEEHELGESCRWLLVGWLVLLLVVVVWWLVLVGWCWLVGVWLVGIVGIVGSVGSVGIVLNDAML